MPSAIPEAAREPAMMTVSDVARYMSVSEEMIRIWLREGQLKGMKTGRKQQSHWRVTRAEVDRFVAAGGPEA